MGFFKKFKKEDKTEEDIDSMEDENSKLSEKDKDAFKIMGLEFNADWLSIQK